MWKSQSKFLMHSLWTFKGKLFEKVEDTQNLTIPYRKAWRRGFQIISYMFNLKISVFKISVSQSNLLYPKYGVYVHNYWNRQKMLKRIKMLTLKWHQKEENFFAHHFRSLKCIRFVENKFFCREGGGGVLNLLDYSPLLGPQGIWLDQIGTCTTK